MTKYEKKLYDEFIASGKMKICRPGRARGTNSIVCINKRSKKNLTYSDTLMRGVRCMNFESIYNIPSVYNGVKMFMGREGTASNATPEILK